MSSEDTTQAREECPPSLETLERSYPDYEGQLVHAETLPAQDAAVVDPSTVLPATLAEPFRSAYGQLYTHQATALEHLGSGENVTVTTPTASGKTYVYALQIAKNHLANPSATALLVYPTKALSRDQEAELNEFFGELGVDLAVRVYDGDTPTHRRRRIREEADIIISNFAGINTYLAFHPKWHRFYHNCQLFAIDESHTYTGVHGMHVAWTIRRLRRLLDYYGSDTQLITTSATIGNPAEHSRRLTGESFTVIDEDGSPRGERELGFWKPPVETADLGPEAEFDDFEGAGSNPLREAAGLLAHLGLEDVQTLLFARSRQGAELAATYAKRAASDHPRDGYLEVAPYHAGLGKQTRRGTEYEFRTGALDGVTSTNALELGIDIGSMDATVLTGYPGTRQSFWQQVGRSGRGTRAALSLFVSRLDALDQYLLDHPEYVLGEPIEDAVVGLENNVVYASHVLAAAHERPLTAADREYFDGDRLDRAVDMFRAAGELDGDLDRAVRYTGSPRPQADISLYGAGDVDFEVRVRDGDIDMEPVDRQRAYRDHHEGALFLHDGAQYEVLELAEDRPNPYLLVEAVKTTEYTETISEKSVRDLAVEDRRELGDGWAVARGTGTVEIHYSHYRRVNYQTGQTTQPLQPTGLPPIELRTDLMWVETPPQLGEEILRALAGEGPHDDGTMMAVFGGGLHGAEHGMIKLAPLELRLDAGDLGGLSTPRHAETGVPTWFVHDAVDGGLGFSHRLFDHLSSIAERTRERVAACDCEGTRGCPACIMDSQCGNQNRYLHTEATVRVLDGLLGRIAD
ncbi:MAG: DEAD/DEAH box helicase [Halodesulfurarchaeum sp.]